MLLDCRDLTSRPVIIGNGIHIVICDTKAKRELAGSAYGERRAQCGEGARRLGAASLREVTPAQFSANAHLLPEIGARQAGAGFGGCMIAFVKTGMVDAFAAAVRSHYSAATGIAPEISPAAAAAGAGRCQS